VTPRTTSKLSAQKCWRATRFRMRRRSTEGVRGGKSKCSNRGRENPNSQLFGATEQLSGALGFRRGHRSGGGTLGKNSLWIPTLTKALSCPVHQSHIEVIHPFKQTVK